MVQLKYHETGHPTTTRSWPMDVDPVTLAVLGTTVADAPAMDTPLELKPQQPWLSHTVSSVYSTWNASSPSPTSAHNLYPTPVYSTCSMASQRVLPNRPALVTASAPIRYSLASPSPLTAAQQTHSYV